MDDVNDVEREMITINTERYKELIEAEKQLNHLESMGVDNWEGYSYYGWDEEDEEDEEDEDDEDDD